MEAAISIETINALVAMVCVAAFFVAASSVRRWRRQRTFGGICCSELEDKPQNRFKRVLADNSYSPFKHFKQEGKEKEISLRMHPFADEIASLLEQPPLTTFMTNHEYSDMSNSYVWIDTEHQLDLLAGLLSKERVFAVDTEQHSLRSFLGFTALMQISTQKEDYVIDTIALHDSMGILRSVFADSSICKVFHGADNDVLWLQRDFHIYVVNMFDTAKACEILSKPQKSLAYLLETYCGVSTDKTLQREDWRLRPLSAEMIEYARNDVHYLLYIADCLVSELKRKPPASPDDKLNFFFEASHRSNMVCMQLYAKEVESTPGASASASILSRNLNIEGITSWRRLEMKDLIWILCAWRDLMARIHDESLRYVLSDHAIAALAVKAPKSPTEIYDIILHVDISNGLNAHPALPSPSPIAKNHVEDLCFLLQEMNANVDDSETCWIYASDGRLLCYCDRRKLEWYVQRDLARIVEDDPPAIMLLFEPKGRPEDEDNEFYIQSKKNMCVGCGEKSHYIRYRIIPSCYRMHFPEHLKSHRSHDIVLLCVDCHEVAHSAAEKYKKKVAQEFGIPLFVQKIVNLGESTVATVASTSVNLTEETGVSPLQLRTAAMALLRHGSNMPSGRLEELMQIVKTYFGRQEISAEDLEAALLVGMSPHERRRFEKKRGLSIRHNEQNIIYKNDTSSIVQTAEDNDKNGSMYVAEESSEYKFKYTDSGQRSLSNASTIVTSSASLLDHNASVANSIQILDRVQEIEQENVSNMNEGNKNENPSDEARRNLIPSMSEVASSGTTKKVSLLGHGPHGKQVVEHLLCKYGEDGIQQFCQRWRKVFVDAIHPRFLPYGWDIMHSGRRDFGEYSVYSPAKRAVQEANDLD
ncbi:hypothetical protein OPV22_003584 [Ensete ventricosum]|uniref:3'-5' exonuclease domain-containing protein n=1 Tax=Ensete ventricosum TaxID=4639 RepID=A0AAV8S109_ENSVE|nr:hypothetical protein OPV22_003584 [Ensete ventricosum]